MHIEVTDNGKIIAGEVTTLRDGDIATVTKLFEQIATDIGAGVGDGAYHQKRMGYYIKQDKNCGKAIFIGAPNNGIKIMAIG